MPKARQQNFLQGGLILSGAVIVVNILVAIFKIPMTNLIG